MEKKLAAYRAQKDREAKIIGIKTKVKKFFSMDSKQKQDDIADPQVSVALLSSSEETDVIEEECCSPNVTTGPTNTSYKHYIYYLLWFALWLVLFMICLEAQFGLVYLVSSAIVLMYLNTRTGPRDPNEVSAYSVFNKDCKSIDGTLKAEQFEREIRYGAGSVR